MKNGEKDVNELRKIAGLSKVAEVHRTLDKMGIRAEYHEALAGANIDMNFIVKGLKDIAENGGNDKVKLSSLQTLMKSLGLDKYDTSDDSSKGWEELIREKATQAPKEIVEADYEIIEPETPKDEQARIDSNKKLSDQLYGE